MPVQTVVPVTDLQRTGQTADTVTVRALTGTGQNFSGKNFPVKSDMLIHLLYVQMPEHITVIVYPHTSF